MIASLSAITPFGRPSCKQNSCLTGKQKAHHPAFSLSSAKSEQYEGKAKFLTKRDDDKVEVYFKDDATAFNGGKRAVFTGKGAVNSQISELLYNYLSSQGIAHHFQDRIGDRTLLCRHVMMFALEVVVRFRVAGSLINRTGLTEGTACKPAVIEFYHKRDDLDDPLINFDHIQLLKLASVGEVTALTFQALETADRLRELCELAGLELFDIKFEYGRTASGKVLLADEISPDTCRLRDKATGRMLDKDLFRQDAGDMMSAYREVYSRLLQAVSADNTK